MISWKHSFNRLNEEYEIAKKKKQALDNLYEKGRISQSTHESFDKELSAGIVEIERQQHALLDKMGQKTTDLENQVKTLEMLLTNYEIQHVAGEIDEEIYQLEINLLSNGLATIKGELESIRDAANRICAPIVPEFEAETLPETEVEAAPTQTETPEVAVEAAPTEFNVATEPTAPEVEAEPSFETPQAEETEPQPEEIPTFEAQATEPSETPESQSPVQETAYYETPAEVADIPELEMPSDESTNLEVETSESTEIVDNVEEQSPSEETPVFEANIDETNENPEIETPNENASTEEQQTEDVPTYEAQAQEDNAENANEQAPEESNENVFEEGAIEENVEQLNIYDANIQENVEHPNTEEAAEIEIIAKEAVEIVQGENPEQPIENAEISQDSNAEEQSDLSENAVMEDESNEDNSEGMTESNIEEPQMENADNQTDAIEEVAMGENNMEENAENMDMPETQSFQIESAPAVKEIETQDPLEASTEETTERSGDANDVTPKVSVETPQDTMATSGDESTSDIEPTSDESENSE